MTASTVSTAKASTAKTAPAKTAAKAAPVAPAKAASTASDLPTYYTEEDTKVVRPLGNISNPAFAPVGEGKLPRKGSNIHTILELLAHAGKEGCSVEEIAIAIYGRVERLGTVKVYFGFNILGTGFRVGRILSGDLKDRIVLLQRDGQTVADIHTTFGIGA